MNAPDDDLVAQLLALLESRHGDLTSSPEAPRQLATGGLMRAEALLRGLVSSLSDGRDDLSGLFIRCIWECWCVGMYLLLDGDSAFEHLRGHFRFRFCQYHDELPKGATVPPVPDDLWDGWPEERRDFIVEQIADRVEVQLRDSIHVPVSYSGLSSYDVLHRLESAFSVHAGYALFHRYIRLSDDGTREEVVAQPTIEAVRDRGEYVGAGYTSVLAWHVYDTFGISTTALESLIIPILKRGGMFAE
jgi:hypothetical protein